ncbi:hypothetical protein CHELA17_61578 [Chelatococcus asaccharovorans]|nr:hypothetical protein CHELA17_61578 [Chelatococcus asaccharovorans]
MIPADRRARRRRHRANGSGNRRLCLRRVCLRLITCDRSDEAVTPAWDIDDVPSTVSTVSEGTAKRGQVHPDGRFVDDHPLPYDVQQFMFADDVSGAVNKGDQQIQSTRADPHGLAISQEEPACVIHSEASERYRPRARTSLGVRRGRQDLVRPGGCTTCHSFRSCADIFRPLNMLERTAGLSSENPASLAEI